MLGVCARVAVAVAVLAWRCGDAARAEDAPVGWSRYAVETTVAVSEPATGAELGYRVRGKLALHAAPSPHPSDGSLLLAFRLQEMQVLVRGARDYEVVRSEGEWEATVSAAWRGGRVLRLLHDPALPAARLDLARALLSLFQYQPDGGGERNETDVSGACAVLYETLAPDTVRKMKLRCEHDAALGEAGEARRVVRYTRRAPGDAALAALLADEVVTARLAHLAVKARSLHTLTLLEHRPASDTAPPPPPPPHYVEASLAMPPLAPPDPDDALTAEEAVREFGAALEGQEAGGGGTAEGAAALLRLVPALQAASADALAALLRGDRPLDQLRALCGALGLAGTQAAAAAVRRADTPEPLVREYLAGLALAPAPHPAAVADALALAEETRSASLGDAALLAAAAAAPRAAGDPGLATRVRDRITRSLARCKEEACRRVRVAALGNTRAPEAADTLLAHAESGGEGQGALAALAGVPRLGAGHLGRLVALVANESRSLEERAAALEVVVEREAGAGGDVLPLRTADVWRALHAERGAAAGELRRVLAQRVGALAAAGRGGARALLAALPPQLRGWDAPPGASTVLVRDAGWAGGGWRAELDSRQVTQHGLLRRGRVALVARDATGVTGADLLAVELWTRGLAALAGADAADEEPMAAGLRLAVAGVALPDIDLFEGQGELVGHIWAGTGSSWTRVVRAAWPAALWRGAVPLAGGGVLGVRAGAALAAALDARASVSLWQRAARGALAVRGAAAARLAVRLASPLAAAAAAPPLRLEARAGAAPRLRIHADLDFYEGVTLCVRAATAPHEETRETAAEWGGTRRGRTARTARAGRTLSLGRENDLACRTLRSADDEDEDADAGH